jgi:hypothetical protein
VFDRGSQRLGGRVLGRCREPGTPGIRFAPECVDNSLVAELRREPLDGGTLPQLLD